MAPREPELRPRTWSQKIWYFFARRLLGWRIFGEIPTEIKYVAVVAPHTSNWDFIWLFAASRAVDLPFPNFVAKHTLFRGPIGAMLRAVGGIPVDRTRSGYFVPQMIAAYQQRERLILTITPEGTRDRTEYWRSGFYRIAQGAGVPISLIFIDYARRHAGISACVALSGDVEADMAFIRHFYADCVARHPEKQGPVRLRLQETPADAPAASMDAACSLANPAAGVQNKNDTDRSRH